MARKDLGHTASAKGWHHVRRVVGRLGWGLIDQAFSSIGNFALAFTVARNTAPAELGAFSLVFAAYILVLGASRTISTSPLVVRYSTAEDGEWRDAAADATGSALVVGAAAGGLGAGAALLLDGGVAASFAALAVSLPGLMLQDAWRFAFFAQGKGSQALINDVIATVLLLPILVALDGVEHATVAWFVLAWGGTATVAAVVGIAQSHVRPRPKRIIAWWNRHRDLSGWFLGEFAVVQGAQSVSLYVLIAVTTLDTIGSLRAAATLFGPINILLMAIGLIAVPEGARAIAHSQRRLRIFVVAISLAMVLSVGALGASLLMVPHELGVHLLGDNWDVARPLILLQMIFVAVTSCAAGPRTGLWALGAAKLTFVARVWASLFTATLPALGAITVGGAVGIYWGAILGEAIAVSLWVRQYRSAEKQRLEADAARQQVEG